MSDEWKMPSIPAGRLTAAVPPNPTVRSNELLVGIGERLEDQSEVVRQLVELGHLERDARLASERTARRWRWATFILGVLTLVAAVVGVVVSV